MQKKQTSTGFFLASDSSNLASVQVQIHKILSDDK